MLHHTLWASGSSGLGLGCADPEDSEKPSSSKWVVKVNTEQQVQRQVMDLGAGEGAEQKHLGLYNSGKTGVMEGTDSSPACGSLEFSKWSTRDPEVIPYIPACGALGLCS